MSVRVPRDTRSRPLAFVGADLGGHPGSTILTWMQEDTAWRPAASQSVRAAPRHLQFANLATVQHAETGKLACRPQRLVCGVVQP